MTTPIIPPPRPGADRYGVLFVCLGNICRSPMAEAIFLHLAGQRRLLDRLDVDSCGLGDWHVGGPADPRTIAACKCQNVPVPSIARLWDPARDPERFDLIVPMDRQNYRTLLTRGAPRDRVRMMRHFEPAAPGTGLLFTDAAAIPDVPDPYTGPDSGFDELYRMLHGACRGLVEAIEAAVRERAGVPQPGARGGGDARPERR
jgi:protein-tyrosine phosphatase